MSTRIGIAILAGGRGSRLWPLSRPERPKQFVPILPGGSMLQTTFSRASGVVGAENVVVVGNREHAQLYRDQLPELPAENLILEPDGLGTAPCLGLTSRIEIERDRFDVIVSMPADHVILNVDEWTEAVRAAAEFAETSGKVVSVAALPDGPEVKFGYIMVGQRIGGTEQNPVYEGLRFVEKPSLSTLETMLSEGTCMRNMGTLAFRPEVLFDDLKTHVPDIAKALEIAAQRHFEDAALDDAYRMMPALSIDKSLLQLKDELAVVAGRVESVDAGDFASLGKILETDSDANAVSGRVIVVDAESNTVVTENATVAVVGVKDLVIVVDGDTILVCPKDQTQRIGEVSG